MLLIRIGGSGNLTDWRFEKIKVVVTGCMATKERRISIELGFGMNRYISDADAKEIIENQMTPAFSKGDFAGGLERGLKLLMEEGRRFTASSGAAGAALTSLQKAGFRNAGFVNQPL